MSLAHLTSPICQAALRTYGKVAPGGRGAFRLVRHARRFIPRDRWRSTFKTDDGLHLDLDLAVYPDCCMAFGLYELDVARLLRRLLAEGDHFVDGGANLGYFTLLAARLVGPTGRVDAFEPQPQNTARLHAHLERNGLADRVHVHAEALSDAAGTANIHMFRGSDFNHGCASLFGAAEAASTATQVPTARMDELLADSSPRLIKLDIEGAEPLAVEGMAGLLGGPSAPRLIVEYNVQAAGKAGFAPRAWVDRLLAIQPAYKLHAIGRRLRLIDPDELFTDSVSEANVLAEV